MAAIDRVEIEARRQRYSGLGKKSAAELQQSRVWLELSTQI
jgi:hypothetical protein